MLTFTERCLLITTVKIWIEQKHEVDCPSIELAICLMPAIGNNLNKVFMYKLLCLFGFIFLTGFCRAQKRVTTLTRITSEGDTSRMLCVSNAAGDSLILNKSTIYHVVATEKDADLIVGTDTLHLSFHNANQSVNINKDVYRLYPTFYVHFKQAVLVRHSVIAVLGLLEDNIGDYPIEAALPLTLFTPQTAKRIRSARVITQRSQADMSDSWDCVYPYNQNGKLSTVTATQDKEIRFTKKLSYKGGRLINMEIYRNLESRQITEKIVTYAQYPVLKWHDYVLETGKNRKSELTVTLIRSVK